MLKKTHFSKITIEPESLERVEAIVKVQAVRFVRFISSGMVDYYFAPGRSLIELRPQRPHPHQV